MEKVHSQVSPKVLLITPFIFNFGFYAVVPFLAIFLRDDLLLSSADIALVLGLRTFSQQGMFIFGGALSDIFGARLIILTGCIFRIIGYLLLALGSSLIIVAIGACLTGIGGALFSPSLDSLVSKINDNEDNTHINNSINKPKRTKEQWFAIFAICGEFGAVLGPAIGGLLAVTGAFSFSQIALFGALIFIFAFIWLYIGLPKKIAFEEINSNKTLRGNIKKLGFTLKKVINTIKKPHFLSFILAYSSWLFSYNQLYLALPVELARVGRGDTLGWFFMMASILIITLQIPITKFTSKISAAKALPAGFLILALSFFCVSFFAKNIPAAGIMALFPAILFVFLLTIAQMLIGPCAKGLIPLFCKNDEIGAHYGALASAGGIAVLIGNIIFGEKLDAGLISSPAASLLWLEIGIIPLISSVAFIFILRKK